MLGTSRVLAVFISTKYENVARKNPVLALKASSHGLFVDLL